MTPASPRLRMRSFSLSPITSIQFAMFYLCHYHGKISFSLRRSVGGKKARKVFVPASWRGWRWLRGGGGRGRSRGRRRVVLKLALLLVTECKSSGVDIDCISVAKSPSAAALLSFIVLLLHAGPANDTVFKLSLTKREKKLAMECQRRRTAMGAARRTWLRGGLADGVVSILMTGRDLLDYQLSPQITLLLLSRHTTGAELPRRAAAHRTLRRHAKESCLSWPRSRRRRRHLAQ